MLKFKGGMLGACVIVLSLLIGTAGSVLLNVEASDEPTTRYDYVTDITGLFDLTDEPQYIDFNPASNYTGYTTQYNSNINPTGLDYTQTTTANNYRMITSQGSTSAGASGTVNNSTSLAQVDTNYEKRGSIYTERVNGSDTVASQLVGFKASSLYTWLSSVFTLSNFSQIVVNLSYPATNAPTQRGGFSTIYYDVSAEPPYTSFASVSRWQSITVDPASLTFTYIDQNGNPSLSAYSLYDAYILYGDATQSESYFSGGSLQYGSYPTSLSVSYTSTVTTNNQYTYMIPSQGVTLAGDGYGHSYWDNDTGTTDYDNYQIDVLVGFPIISGTYTKSWDSTPRSFKVALPSGGSYPDEITISTSTNGFIYQYGGGVSGILGKFDAILLSIVRDASDNIKVNLYGVTDFTDYTTAQWAPTPLKTLTLANTSNLDTLRFYSSVLYWSVYNTNMFMDTYGAVMVNPSIDLADYWADMDYYRFAFQSFAIYGDSITINGVTYPVTDETITINDRSYKLNNFYLSFSAQGKASITFRDVNRTIDLGDTTDKVVSFSGIWYFTTGLYEGVPTTERVYNWDVGDFFANLDLTTMVLFTIGVMSVLCLGFIILKVNFSTFDKLIILGGAFVLFLMLGVTQ